MLEELKRRNVIRVGVAYLALAWLVIEVTDVAVPALNLPESLNSIVFYLGVIGLPFALFFAWAFELTPDGLKREHEVDRSQSITVSTGRKIDFIIIGLLLASVSFLAFDNYVLHQSEASGRTALNSNQTAFSSIGVLPFDNMSNDPDQEYFSDGIAEELLNALAKLSNLQVAARTSSFAFKGQNKSITEIGNRLKVDTILEGSVRKSGTRLRITAQLIDVENGYHLWSETYDRELTDVFAIQDELTAAIVSALKVHLDVGEEAKTSAKTENWEAYDSYLKGLHAVRQRTDRSIADAIGYFEQATTLEPDFAMAMARQAQAVMLSVSYGDAPQEDALGKARTLIEKALEQDPELAEAHAGRGYFLLESNDCEKALLSFDRALALNPGLVEALHWRSLCLKSLGRLRPGREAAQHAHQLDPMHASVFTNIAGFETDYGMDVDLDIEAAQENYPDRYLQHRIDGAIRTANWAQVYELARAHPEDPASPMHLIIMKFALGESIEMELPDLLEKEALPVHDIYVFLQILLEDFDEAERHLAGLSSDELEWVSDADAYRGYIRYLSGDYKGAVSLLSKGLTPFPHFNLDYPPFPLSRVNLLISLAEAMRQTGDNKSAEKYLDRARSHIATLKENGAREGYQMPEARSLLMQGEHASAITLLEHVAVTGDQLLMRINDPLLNRLAGNPRMSAVIERIRDHIESERAKLGWPSLSTAEE